MKRIVLSILTISAAACSGGTDTADEWGPSDFSGGSYQFTSTDVADGCLDGAFVAIFLPEGAGSTNDWAYPIELPAWSALPSTLDAQLQDPFSTMEVTIEAGDSEGRMTITSAQQTDVEFDADNNPGCLVDMGINVDIVLDSDTNVHGSATMSTQSFDEDNCPAVEADPCTIDLTFTGVVL